jgi:ankyrin repeat protein
MVTPTSKRKLPLLDTPPSKKQHLNPSDSLTNKKIAHIFATQSPKKVLKQIHKKFPAIHECHCIPQLSRKTGEPDDRAFVEKELPDLLVKMKPPTQDSVLTFCSFASGGTFQDLVLISRMYQKGYRKMKWLLVDPFYSTQRGKRTLDQFMKVAKAINPEILIGTADRTQLHNEVWVERRIVPDVFFLSDTERLGMSFEAYAEEMSKLEKDVQQLTNSTIILRSEKTRMDFAFFNKKLHCNEKHEVTIRCFNSKEKIENLDLLTMVPNEMASAHRSYFFEAIARSDVPAIQWFLNHGMSPNITDSEGNTPLMFAILKAQFSAMRILIKEGHASVNAKDNSRTTALHLLATVPNTLETEKAVHFLINHDADIDVQDVDGITPLIKSILGGNVPMMRALLARGAKTDIVDGNGETARTHFEHFFSKVYPDRLSKEAMAEFRPLLGPIESHQKSAFFKAIKKGHLYMVKWFLNNGILPNISNSIGSTPLMVAIKKGQFNIMRMLIKEAHANVNIKDSTEKTALHWLSDAPGTALEVEEAVNLLLDHDADIDAIVGGMTALMLTIVDGNVPMMRALLARGARTDLVDEEGDTALAIFDNHFLNVHSDKLSEEEIVEIRTRLGAEG